MALHTYNGFKLTIRLSPDGLKGEVAVFDPQFKRDPALYKTTSLELAMKWVDAYQKGEQWAIDAKNDR